MNLYYHKVLHRWDDWKVWFACSFLSRGIFKGFMERAKGEFISSSFLYFQGWSKRSIMGMTKAEIIHRKCSKFPKMINRFLAVEK